MFRSAYYSPLSSQSSHRLPSFAFAVITGALVFFLIVGGIYSSSSTISRHLISHAVSQSRQSSLDSILNATLGFERVLAINLPERCDHKDALVLASAVSGFHIDFIDGVHGEKVPSKTLPPLHTDDLPSGAVGAWRAHMNALSSVVENKWTSALILEDDADWDVRLKSILQKFAAASNHLLNSKLPANVYDLDGLPKASVPLTSPYGDNWDILWLGHCYMEINETAPIILRQDDTTAAKKYLTFYEPRENTSMTTFPQHTRAVFRHQGGICSLAYAVSQAGARALLHEVGIRRFTEPLDLMMQHFCDGTYGIDRPHSCISVLPQIFDQHREAGSVAKDSDINNAGDGERQHAFTPNIRWSVRMNLDKMIHGEQGFVDQYPD